MKTDTRRLMMFAAALVFALIYFRSYLYFWKFSYNRLDRTVSAAEAAPDLKERQELLEKAAAACDKYRAQNPLQSDAYFISARAQ